MKEESQREKSSILGFIPQMATTAGAKDRSQELPLDSCREGGGR